MQVTKCVNYLKMTELQTILGTDIPTTTRGILYLCKYDYITNEIGVLREILFDCGFDALNAYANIPNPESQLVTGKTYDALIAELHILHSNLKDPEWVKELADYL